MGGSVKGCSPSRDRVEAEIVRRQSSCGPGLASKTLAGYELCVVVISCSSPVLRSVWWTMAKCRTKIGEDVLCRIIWIRCQHVVGKRDVHSWGRTCVVISSMEMDHKKESVPCMAFLNISVLLTSLGEKDVPSSEFVLMTIGTCTKAPSLNCSEDCRAMISSSI